MSAFCPNCNTCTCTGAYLIKAKDGRTCCSKCISKVNVEIDQLLSVSPNLTYRDLKRKNKKQ
jgi:hypothetical protein